MPPLIPATPSSGSLEASPRRVPGPSNPPIIGQLLSLRKDPVGFLKRLGDEYGDIAHFRVAGHDAYLINSPDYIREVLTTSPDNFSKSLMLKKLRLLVGDGLLTSEADKHRRQRRLVQPAFHHDRLASYADIMSGGAARFSDRWIHGSTLRLADEMTHYTLWVVAMTLFSADVEHQGAQIGQSLTDCLKMFDLLLRVPLASFLLKLPLPGVRRYNRAFQRLDEIIYEIIEQRRTTGEDKGDLLSMLTMARDADGTRMEVKQIRDEALTLFLAGHETTANALTWTWYLLSQNPACAARLHEEVDMALEGRRPGVGDIPSLSYTSMVFAESMRMYPPFWCIGRIALQEFALGDFVVPAGAICIVSPYVTQHDARYFPDPDRFDPERWTPRAKESLPKFAYLPFGAGSRMCVGERFAWMESVLAIATIARRWDLELAPGQSGKPLPVLSLRPRDGMRMVLRERHRSSSGLHRAAR